METGKLIKELRTKKGMTQEELAELTELSTRTIQRIENGEVDPRAYTLQMISQALEVDFEIFVEIETDEEKEKQKVIDNNYLGLMHLSGLLPLIFPTVILWNRKKGDIKEITNHYRAVISFQLTIWAIILGGLWVFWKANNLIPLITAFFVCGLLSVINAIKVMNGEPYKIFLINKFIGKKGETK